MVPSTFNLSALSLVGTAALLGCRPLPQKTPQAPPQRTPYPDFPSPDDPLAVDPCSVKTSPDVFLRDVEDHKLLVALHENLAFLQEINPAFVCGLQRIEMLGDEAYRTSAPEEYTRRSVGLYTPNDFVIRLKAGAGIVLTHEVGHHIHNLGYFARTVRDFLAQSWTLDPNSGLRAPHCGGSDCFLNEAAAKDPKEDWARTFERVLMRPIETGVASNFSLKGPTPLQEKIRLIRSISKLPEPVRGTARFGEARLLDAKEARELKNASDSAELPPSLAAETVRRIFLAGKRRIRPSTWNQRRRPFLAGDHVVFPVFLEDQKRLGFFAYDLKKEEMRAVELSLENIPESFRTQADAFTLLTVSERNGELLLIGFQEGKDTLTAPIAFSF